MIQKECALSDEYERDAVIVSLVKSMQEEGSWCGQTHIQKCVFLLQDFFSIPLDLQFTLYHYGPYSFDLKDEIALLLSRDFLSLDMRNDQYGPRILPGPLGAALLVKYDDKIQCYKSAIDFIASSFGKKTVKELERLTTAHYVLSYLKSDDPAGTISLLKPHIDRISAETAIDEIQIVAQGAHLISA